MKKEFKQIIELINKDTDIKRDERDVKYKKYIKLCKGK